MPNQSQSPMIVTADAQHIPLADESVQCVVTSPPYYALRKYSENGECNATFSGDPACEHEWRHDRWYSECGGMKASRDAFAKAGPWNARRIRQARWREADTCERCGAWRGELGHEPTPALFVEHLTAIFAEVKRVLRKDGTCWIVVGDSYAGSNKGTSKDGTSRQGAKQRTNPGSIGVPVPAWDEVGLKKKDLIGVPWMLAFALRDDGWFLRQMIVWDKKNPMPEGDLADRFVRAHEFVILLSKARRYYFAKGLRRLGSVWHVSPQEKNNGHHATFPSQLARICVRAGSRPGGLVLDPFCGSGTTVEAANAERRVGIGLDLMHGYCTEHAVKRGRRGIAEGRQLPLVEVA